MNINGADQALDLGMLSNVRERGNKTIARCPACAETGADRKGEHLVITTDGRFGCVQNPGADGSEHRSRIFEMVGIPRQQDASTLDAVIANMVRKLGRPEARRDWYHNADGSERFAVVRFDGNGGKEFRPFHRNGTGWIVKDPSGKLPLFKLPDLIKRPDERVYVVEGEKCASELATLGVLVTTSAHGAKASHKTDWSPLAGREVVLIPDNDEDGRAYARSVSRVLTQLEPPSRVCVVHLPNLPAKGDCVEWLAMRDAQSPEDILAELEKLVRAASTETLGENPVREPRIRFYQPSELRDYRPESDIALVGDCHIMRGEVFVIGGEPGVGKSRSATALAVAGATGGEWLGLPVHRQFRTMIVQSENGRHRLQQEYSTVRCEELDDWIRVSEPPPFGLTLNNSEFQEDVRAALASFKPQCVILDPWNAVTRDDKQRDYAETFEALRRLLPTGPDKPALGIVAHTRKPAANEKRTGGTGLMHVLSGSHMLVSLPRSVFVMVRGSEDEKSDSIVWCNPKNNNGALTDRTAWLRRDGMFQPDLDFDWKEFEKTPDKRVIVRIEDLAEVFKDGDQGLKDAAHMLATLTGISENGAYNALKPTGKFAEHLTRKGNLVSFTP